MKNYLKTFLLGAVVVASLGSFSEALAQQTMNGAGQYTAPDCERLCCGTSQQYHYVCQACPC